MDWTRMYIEIGLNPDLLLSNYSPFEINFKQFISGASNYVAITKVARISERCNAHKDFDDK